MQWTKFNLAEFVRDVPPLWDQRDNKYHKRCLKPKFLDALEYKLKFTVSTEIITPT